MPDSNLTYGFTKKLKGYSVTFDYNEKGEWRYAAYKDSPFSTTSHIRQHGFKSLGRAIGAAIERITHVKQQSSTTFKQHVKQYYGRS